MEDFTYYMPTKVLWGIDAVKKHGQHLKSLGTRAYIITYPIPGRHPALEDVTAVFQNENIPYMVDMDIEENPSTETVSAAAQRACAFGADFIVGIGGGSPIDAAKAVGVLIKNPGIDPLKLYEDGVLESVPIAAVPTTAGTGSEVTHFSVLTRTDRQTKQAIAPKIFPKLALMDANYLMGMPLGLTRATAIDALCHCIESYVSTAGSPLSRSLCEIGFRAFAGCVSAMERDQYTLEIREKQMFISMIGGFCNAQTGTSLPHGMSYALTHNKRIPHGLACGLLEVEYLKIFRDQSKINQIVALCGFSSLEAFGNFIDGQLDVNIDISEEEIEQFAEEFSQQKHRFARHPEAAGKAEVLQIYRNSLLKRRKEPITH